MRRRIEPVGEQALDRVAAELPGRQTDRVDHDQVDLDARRAGVLIRRINDPHR
jgi:hypothetical protein